MNDMYYHHHPGKAMAMAANNNPSHSDGKHFWKDTFIIVKFSQVLYTI